MKFHNKSGAYFQKNIERGRMKDKVNCFSTVKGFKKKITPNITNGFGTPRPNFQHPRTPGPLATPKQELIDQERKNLPIAGVRLKILEAIEKNETIILIGETASGKTTQIPQFILRSKLGVMFAKRNQMIGITQPRRVAAISVARRVADEMNVNLGGKVGYSVRFENCTNHDTQIKYMTDGMLLRESLEDPLMKKYGCIILDECHERSIITDVLFGIVKAAQKERKEKQLQPLKVVLMSATMDVDQISMYFNNAPVYYVSGRQYPIKIYHASQKQDDYVHAALTTVFQIHQSEPPGDILVFCTGQDEIESMVAVAKDTAKQLPYGIPQITVLPLYAALPSNQQMKIFGSTQLRKIIFATNIAETSITIPGVKYVVDTGKVKCRTYKASEKFEILKVVNISKAQAIQRAGRAGRESSGSCYRLYTEDEYQTMDEYSIPEILRCNLISVLLHLAGLGIKNWINFDFIDKPSIENIKNATNVLIDLGSLERLQEDSYKLTDLGKKMLHFPVEPQFSRVILAAADMGCSDEVLTIISMLNCEKIFHIPSTKKENSAEVLKKFHSSEGDHIMLLNVYKAFKSANGNQQWCQENYISVKEMKMVLLIRQQLSMLYEKLKLERRSCGQNTESIRKCLVAGLFGNLAVLQKDGSYKAISSKLEVYIHPSSCLFNKKPECVVYTDLVQTTKCYMKNISVVDQLWLPNHQPSTVQVCVKSKST